MTNKNKICRKEDKLKNIKKLFLLLLVVTAVVSLTGCGKENILDGTLKEIMENIYSDVYAGLADDEKPMLETINVSTDMQDNIPYYIGTDEIEYEEILASEPMMGSIAHSVVLVRMKDGADIESAKQKILDTVDPRKWVCVGVEKEDVIVKNKGNLIILIIVEDETTRTKLEEGFDNL